MRILISELIKIYNKENSTKITQGDLAEYVLTDYEIKNKKQHINGWNTGRSFTHFNPDTIKRTCIYLQTTPNKLFGIN